MTRGFFEQSDLCKKHLAHDDRNLARIGPNNARRALFPGLLNNIAKCLATGESLEIFRTECALYRGKGWKERATQGRDAILRLAPELDDPRLWTSTGILKKIPANIGGWKMTLEETTSHLRRLAKNL